MKRHASVDIRQIRLVFADKVKNAVENLSGRSYSVLKHPWTNNKDVLASKHLDMAR